MTASTPPSSARGRPAATSHAAIEQAAFRLFAERGFEQTTLEDIAAEVGVARRTLTRYYRSKNDIPWGQFERTLSHFQSLLAAMPATLPTWECVHRGVLAFNDFPGNARPSHEERMRLILRTPALQAHSVLRYAAWRAVIEEFVADRTGLASYDVLPRAVGHVCLGLALSAYEAWLDDPAASLPALLEESMGSLRDFLEVT